MSWERRPTNLIPQVGHEIELPYTDGTPTVNVRCIHSFGVARLMAVETEAGGQGVIAFQPDGSWWWVREPVERDGAWEADDPDAWKRA